MHESPSSGESAFESKLISREEIEQILKKQLTKMK